jgi:hypothetical protein
VADAAGPASADRARGRARPAARRDPAPAPYRRSRDPLVALSAVEKRGRLARIEDVAFVAGPGDSAAPPAAPVLADTAPGGPIGDAASFPGAGSADPSLTASDLAPAYDAVAPRSRRRLQAPCQIVRVEQVRAGTVVDLVTLGPCRVDGEVVPAGSPLALGFGLVPRGAACQELDAVMGYWEAIGAVVDLEVAESDQATRYRFDCRDDGLALLVQAERA